MGVAFFNMPPIVYQPRFTNRANTPKGWIQGSRRKRRGGVRKARYWRTKGIEERYIRNYLRYKDYATYPNHQMKARVI